MSPESPSPDAPDFAAADAALVALGAAQGAADAHGVLCALLAAPAATDVRAWLEFVGADRAGELPTALIALHAATVHQLAPASYDFTPLLPDDDAPLSDRVRALAQWCQGFLGGLGLCGVDPAALDGDDPPEEAERDYIELVEYLRVGVYLVRDALHDTAAPAEEHT